MMPNVLPMKMPNTLIQIGLCSLVEPRYILTISVTTVLTLILITLLYRPASDACISGEKPGSACVVSAIPTHVPIASIAPNIVPKVSPMIRSCKLGVVLPSFRKSINEYAAFSSRVEAWRR